MTRRPLVSDRLPTPVLPYSVAIEGPPQLWLSGLIGLRPGTFEPAGDTAAEQLAQVFENLDTILREAGKTEADVVKVTLYMVDLAEFAAVNEAYGRYFTSPYPARTAIAVAALPAGARIEADVIVG